MAEREVALTMSQMAEAIVAYLEKHKHIASRGEHIDITLKGMPLMCPVSTVAATVRISASESQPE